ncbi:MAG: UDP-N-acetylmuramate dehydrogenase [Peptostreptococcaceae bacterium]|nr:UDP-N-acetylmuramate dehydrogenase [Peptostreptococcaceae bacterium]
MENKEIYEEIKKIIPKDRLLIDEPMKNHTAFKIGGPADLMVLPKSVEEIEKILNLLGSCEEGCFIMGNGSNLLVSDKGIRGTVLKIGDQFSNVDIEETAIRAQSGVLLSSLSKMAAKESLTGIEFAGGIPGTLGGAVAMNAGAYGGEMKDLVEEVTLIDRKGKITKLGRDAMSFGYRTSIVSEGNQIVLEALLKLRKGDAAEILGKMNEFSMRRSEKQPLAVPSAGSTFKRPEGYYAGKLIQEAGLKGLRHGDAMVSDKHSGFIVNTGDASAEDVLSLIKTVQKVVFDKFGVMLETEVKFIGER